MSPFTNSVHQTQHQWCNEVKKVHPAGAVYRSVKLLLLLDLWKVWFWLVAPLVAPLLPQKLPDYRRFHLKKIVKGLFLFICYFCG